MEKELAQRNKRQPPVADAQPAQHGFAYHRIDTSEKTDLILVGAILAAVWMGGGGSAVTRPV